MPLAFFEKQYKASAHPRVLSRAMTEAQVTKFLHDGMSKHVNANNFISEEAFMNYYLDTSCMMPAALDNFFQESICSVWGINNPTENHNTRSNNYVASARICQLEDILLEKIRQKTHGTEDEGKTIRKIFKHHDMQGYGTINCKEFTKAIETLGCYFKPVETQALFNKFDSNCSGMVDYEEFSGWVACRGTGNNPNVKAQFKTVRMPPNACLEKIRTNLRMKGINGMRGMIALFRKFDVNGDNRLDRHEISWLLKQNGHYLTQGDFESLFRYFDKNNDGVLSLSELVHGIRGELKEERMCWVKEAW